MNQHFEPVALPQTGATFASSTSLTSAATKSGDVCLSAELSMLSPLGQKTVSAYFAQMEVDLARRAALSGEMPLSAFERTEILREMHTHLLSLIAAYQEIGDDEQTAIASAIAQFGSAKSVAGGLRRVKTRASGSPFDLAVPMALFTLAMLMPLFLLVGTQHSDLGQFGWPGLFLLPFAAGAFAASRKGEGALRKVLAAIGLIITSTFLMSLVLTEQVQTVHGFFAVLRFAILLAFVWSLSAGAGWIALRKTSDLTANKKED